MREVMQSSRNLHNRYWSQAQTVSMSVTRKKFVLLFLASGFALDFATRFLLNQEPDALWASPDQAGWQRVGTTILSPLRVVLVGPISWLQQDPDPPPPFRLILLAAYWSLLALGIHYLISRRRAAA
jgi:hypothetical protein